MARPFLHGDHVVAAGGTVRVANGSQAQSGRVRVARAPRTMLAGIQAVEYLRAFCFGYRQLTAYWRLRGLVKFMRGRTDWGVMTRTGFAPPASSPDTSAA